MGSGNIKAAAFVPLDSRPPSYTPDGCDDWGDENDGEKCHPRRGRCRMRAARLTGFGIIYRYLTLGLLRYLTEGLLFPG